MTPSPSPSRSAESTGLLELVPPRPHLDRRLDASSCCRKLMLRESPPPRRDAGKENQSGRRSKQPRAAMSSKKILGERTTNLGHIGAGNLGEISVEDPILGDSGRKGMENPEDRAEILGKEGSVVADQALEEILGKETPIVVDSALGEGILGEERSIVVAALASIVNGGIPGENEGSTTPTKEKQDADEHSPIPSDISKTILDILESSSIEAEQPPPYDPVLNPFSPRPRFLRLKRGAGNNKAEQSPYHPESNPLTPRPEFLRYNPTMHKEFIEARPIGRALLFPDVDDGAPELPGLKRSASCPELVVEDPVPPLEKVSIVSDEPETMPPTSKLASIESPVAAAGRSSVWRRALMMLVLLGFFATGIFVLRSRADFFRDLGQEMVFRARELMIPGVDEEVGYSGSWDIVAGVSNYSMIVFPEVGEEIILSGLDEDGIPETIDELVDAETAIASTDLEEHVEMVLEQDNDSAAEGISLASDEDESSISERCSRFRWEESIVKMCLENTILDRSPDQEPDQAADQAADPAADQALDQAADPAADPAADQAVDQAVDQDQAATVDDSDEAALLDFLTSLPTDSTNDAADWSTPTLIHRASIYLSSLGLVGSLSVLGLAGAAIVCWYMKRRPRGVAAGAAEQQRVPPAVSDPTLARSRSPADSSSSGDDERSGSGSTSTTNSSNNERYGSFTTLEAVDVAGEIKVTPVRRSSRIRSRSSNQSPMILSQA